MNTEKTTEAAETRQPRTLYYEPSHKPWDERSIRLAFRLRGWRVSGDTSLRDEPGPAVLREGQGRLVVTDGSKVQPLPEMEDYPSAGAYASAIADWLNHGELSVPAEPHCHLTAPMVGAGGQAEHLQFLVGAWADRPPADDPTPTGMFFPGCRSEAVEVIDLMLEQLHELRSALGQEGRRYEDAVMAHLDAKYGKPGGVR